MAHLDSAALAMVGFGTHGDPVSISDKASFYNPGHISVGSYVRIDDFCILSTGQGGIRIGSHIHVGAYSSMIGVEAIVVEDFANISSRVSIYSSSDDYSGATMSNPMVPDRFKNVDHAPVRIGRHVIVGCGTVILPGVELPEGVAIGAMSLVKTSCEPFTIYAGVPARPVGKRSQALLEREAEFLAGRTGDR